jgi:aspartate ammonia-lyase
MANDFRLMSSGPRCGFEEINLPPMQNGSSIMPGKVNPVIPEVMSQAAFCIIGNDMSITMAAEAGQLELNYAEPVLYHKLFESITVLAGAVQTFTDNCVTGITANEARCRELVDGSVGVITAICPKVGYKESANIAKKAIATGASVREVLKDMGVEKAKVTVADRGALDCVLRARVETAVLRGKE